MCVSGSSFIYTVHNIPSEPERNGAEYTISYDVYASMGFIPGLALAIVLAIFVTHGGWIDRVLLCLFVQPVFGCPDGLVWLVPGSL